MSIDALSAGLPVTAVGGPGAKDSPAKILDAAKQFEALLMAQLLKSVRDSEGGWMGTGDDQSGSSAMDYAQEMFAQSLSAQGGLGLASLVARGLQRPGSD